jgi:hypothetical protein
VTTDPNQSAPDPPLPEQPDPETQSTPAGIVEDMEEEAEELGATTEPSTPPPT